MPFDTIYLIYGALFLGALLLFEGIAYLIIDIRGTRRDPNRRLRMLGAGESRAKVLVKLRRERQFEAAGGRAHPLAGFETLLVQSGLGTTPMKFLGIMFALTMAAFVVVFALRREPFVAASIGGVAGLLLPLLFLLLKRRRRLNLFARQLPDAIEVIVRSLRAGHPVPTAIGMVAREMQDPIGSEFGVAVDEMTYGLDLDDALENMSRRVGLPDMSFLVVAVAIQAQVGGNLAEILANLSRVIRERFRMRGKIRALSAEGRMSAIVLSILPIVLMGVISIVAPTYYGEVKGDPLFLPALIFGFSLMVFGVIVMYRLVKFRV